MTKKKQGVLITAVVTGAFFAGQKSVDVDLEKAKVYAEMQVKIDQQRLMLGN